MADAFLSTVNRELTEERGHRSSHRSRDDDRPRRRSRSPHREERRRRGEDRDRERDRERGEREHGRDRDRDRDRRSSRYDERDHRYEPRRASLLHDDVDRRRRDDPYAGRSRSRRSPRDRSPPLDSRDRDRDRDRFARRDDVNNSGGRRRGGGNGGGFGGGAGGYGNGSGADGGVFGSPNIRRSPTPEGTIPISKRPRKYTAWDVKPPGYENMSAMEAKISGSFMLPGQTRPASQTPGGPMNGNNGNMHGNPMPNNGGFGSHGPPNSNHHWVNPNNPNQHNPHAHGHMPGQHQNQFQMPISRDGGFGMPGSLPPIHFKPAQGQSGPVAQTQSFARQARRLYVGNILHTANEMNVAEFFNAKMKELGLLSKNSEDGLGPSISENPVVAVQVNHEKNYAFVEFRNAEEATHGMSFDGIIFQNQALKIRRPKDYTGPDHAGPTHIPGVVSTNVPDSPNKIFIGGLPSYLTDDQVMELLKSFGELKSFNLVKDTSSGGHVSKGFAFCEYVDPDLTDIACQGLNGMELGDRYLVVQRAQIGQNAKKDKENNPDHQGQRNNNNYNNQLNSFGGQAPAAAASVLAAVKGGEGEKTRVLQMLNMVNPEELVDDQEYSEILEDIRDECGKYGAIEDVKIPRPIRNEKGRIDLKASEAVEGLGKVFIMFEKVEECTAALMAIAGRQFAGRVIICAYAPEEVMNSEKKAEESQEPNTPPSQ